MNGARQALNDYGLQPLLEAVEEKKIEMFDFGYEVATDLLQRPIPPTAIFAMTDLQALGVLHAASDLGLSLPRDLSVIGFDNLPLKRYSLPELTTVSQPIQRMGEAVAQILLRQMSSHNAPLERIAFDTQLVIRSSTAAPP